MSGIPVCEIRHLFLQDPPSALAAQIPGSSVLAVFWWGPLPLGSRMFSPGELPVPASAIPALAAATVAPALRFRCVTAEDPTPETAITAIEARAAAPCSVSVVVCTRDRPQSLARCLDSLRRCDPPPTEIVVVDNAPDRPATRQVVEARPGLRWVPEPRPGLSHARNTGLSTTSGEIVAFTDDDVEVAPNWLTPIRAAFEEPDVACVTGLVLPAELDSEAALAFEFDFGGLARSFLPVRYDREFLDRPFWKAPPVWTMGAGANLAVRRTILEAVGLFDPRLGAGAAGCSEDSEFLHRALRAGWVCRYEPAAVVHHHHRPTPEALCRQMRAYMRGHVAALLVQFGQTRRPEHLIRAFLALPWGYAKTGVRLLLSPPSLRHRVYTWEVLGVVEGYVALLRR
jgi:GT2 family glycosyltransferase